LISKLDHILGLLKNPGNGQTADDLLAQSSILQEFITAPFHHGFKTGFDAMQMAIFMSIYTSILKEIVGNLLIIVESIRMNKSILESDLPHIFKTEFGKYRELQEACIMESESNFTSSQCRDLISFITSTIGCHFKLLKYVCSNPQTLLISKFTKKIEQQVLAVPSLANAIRDENWAQYCQDEEKVKMLEREYPEALELMHLEIEAEKQEQELADSKTRSIVARIGITVF
jgi:Flagellar C1a complex subunit C1a-32